MQLNSYKKKSKRLYLDILFIFLILSILFIVTVTKIPHLPQRTHDIASFMAINKCLDCGLGHLANSMIISPSYIFFGYLLNTIKGYFLTQSIFFLISLISISIIFTYITKNKYRIIFFKMSIIFSSIILLLNFLEGNWSNVPEYLSIGINFLNYNFSTRSVLSLFYLFACFFLLKRKYILSCTFIILSLISHPTNGLIISISFLGLIVFNYIFKLGLNKKFIKYLILSLIIGFIPIIIKLFTLDVTFSNYQSTEVSTSEYIYSMYIDEIDDFSALYQLFSSKLPLTISLIFSFSPILLYLLFLKKIKKSKNIEILASLIITPLIIFSFILSIEIIHYYFGYFEFLIEKIINSQLGSRIMKYSGIPSILLWLLVIERFLKYNLLKLTNRHQLIKFLNITIIFTNITFISLIITYDKKIKIKEVNNLLKSEATKFSFDGRMAYYEDLLLAGYSEFDINNRFLYDCKCGDIFIKTNDEIIKNSKKILMKKNHNDDGFTKDFNFHNNYENYNSRINIIKTIKNILPKTSKIITPPYFYCFREFLPNYDIFFQEHDDINFALGSKKIFEKMKTRMDYLSISFLKVPSQVSGLFSNSLRNTWLDLNEKNIKNKLKSNNFKFLLTESEHKINLNIFYKDKDWIIYYIN